MSEKIEIRDLRKQDWVWTSKALLFHPNVDEKMYKVYCGLAAYADNRTQEAFPSIDTLADNLHMGRKVVIRALQRLEAQTIIEIERRKGLHNIYTLKDVDVPVKPKKPEPETPDEPPAPPQETPGQIAKEFFKGVRDLQDKQESLEGSMVKNLLLTFTEKYPTVPKGIMWTEIKAFERYWTELNKTGTKQRWEKEDAFQVERRIVTWFSKKKEFAPRVDGAPKNSKVATL